MGRDNFLDIIRAIAVTMVVFTHFHGWLPGGSMGVSIFFCLSGYLICRILIDLPEPSLANISKFIFRRFMRVWPMMAFQIVLTFALMMIREPQEVPSYLASVPGLITFTGGYLSWVGLSPAVLWTLRAEFWFYVFFAAAFFTLRRRYLPWVIAATIVVSWIVKFRIGHGPAVFAILYGDQLMYGAACALILEKPPAWLRLFKSRAMLWASLFALGLLSAVPFKEYDWIWYLQTSDAALWTAMIILHNGINPLRGDFEPLATIGRVSFSIYLLHAVFIDYVSAHIVNSTFDAVLIFSGVVGTSIFTYLFVELPMIRLSKRIAYFQPPKHEASLSRAA